MIKGYLTVVLTMNYMSKYIEKHKTFGKAFQLRHFVEEKDNYKQSVQNKPG